MQFLARHAIANPTHSLEKLKVVLEETYAKEAFEVSISTIWRALNKAGIKHMRASLNDPKALAGTHRKVEHENFMKEQRDGRLFRESIKIAIDESNFPLADTQQHGWGSAANQSVIPKTKGKTKYTNVFAAMGLIHVRESIDVKSVLQSLQKINPIQNEDTGTLQCNLIKIPENAKDADHKVIGYTREPERARLHEDGLHALLFWWKVRPSRRDDKLSLTYDPTQEVTHVIYPDNEFKYTGRSMIPIADVTDEFKKILISMFEFLNSVNTTGIFDPAENENAEEAETTQSSDNIKLADIRKFLMINAIEDRQVNKDGSLKSFKNNRSLTYQVATNRQLIKRLSVFIPVDGTYTYRPRTDSEILSFMGSANALLDVDGQEEELIPRHFFTPSSRLYKGGTFVPNLGSLNVFMQFCHRLSQYIKIVYGEEVASNTLLMWDNASTHANVAVNSGKASFMHKWVEEELGLKDAIYLPVRQPRYDPVEFLFSFVKSIVRSLNTKAEMTQDELERNIDEAMMRVQPQHVVNWFRYGCYPIDANEYKGPLPEPWIRREMEAFSI